jgi:4a-hydroxytetrahydrobiopterin dehydratase
MTHQEKIPVGWQPTDKTIHKTFKTNSFEKGVDFINLIRPLATEANHHPDIILTFAAVIVTLTTHDEGMVTLKDIAMAGQINEVWNSRFGNA